MEALRFTSRKPSAKHRTLPFICCSCMCEPNLLQANQGTLIKYQNVFAPQLHQKFTCWKSAFLFNTSFAFQSASEGSCSSIFRCVFDANLWDSSCVGWILCIGVNFETTPVFFFWKLAWHPHTNTILQTLALGILIWPTGKADKWAQVLQSHVMPKWKRTRCKSQQRRKAVGQPWLTVNNQDECLPESSFFRCSISTQETEKVHTMSESLWQLGTCRIIRAVLCRICKNKILFLFSSKSMNEA